jgi:hypothetical protein
LLVVADLVVRVPPVVAIPLLVVADLVVRVPLVLTMPSLEATSPATYHLAALLPRTRVVATYLKLATVYLYLITATTGHLIFKT